MTMCASLHLVHTQRYPTTHSHITVRLMITYSDLHLCYLETAFLNTPACISLGPQCSAKWYKLFTQSFFSNYKHFCVSNIRQLSGLYHYCLLSPPPSMKVVECKQLNEGVNTCAWTSCSGCFLYNWPLKMHTSTIETRMTRPTMMTAPPRHPITTYMYTTEIEGAAGQNVYRQGRTTQSLWIAWRNVHWVGGTHTLIYCRYKWLYIIWPKGLTTGGLSVGCMGRRFRLCRLTTTGAYIYI